MSISKDFLLEINRRQAVSETDSFTPDRYRQMFQHIPKTAVTVLDIGCNTGRGGAILKSANPRLELTGMDCVQERIDALDPAIYSQRVCAFSTDIPFADNTFDAIVAGEFLEHLPPAQIDTTLCELFRILRLHGRLILTTPNPHYLKNKLRQLSVLLEDSHLTQHYPACLTLRLKMIGYSQVKVFGSGRLTRLIGQHFPLLSVYGSYLISARKW